MIQDLRNLKSDLIEMEPPQEIVSREDWMSWRIAQRFKDDSPEMPELLGQRRKLSDEIQLAENSGKREKALELNMQLMKITARISESMKQSKAR